MRCTIDHDGGLYDKNPKLLYYRLKMETGEEVKMYRSSSGRGYHYVVQNVDPLLVNELRAKYDDSFRYWLDGESKTKPKQVLWDRKTTPEGHVFRKTRIRNMLQLDKVRKVMNPWR